MARTVHRLWHPELSGRLDITRDDDLFRLRVDPSIAPGREDVVGCLHEASGSDALKRLGHETVARIAGQLHQEYKQLDYQSRDTRSAIGVTLAALVVHLQDEGLGHSVSPEIMETVSRLIDDGVGRDVLERMSVVSTGRQAHVIDERRRSIAETRHAVTSMFETPAEASGQQPSFEESLDRLRGVVSGEGGSLREQAGAIAGGRRYASSVREGFEALDEERRRLEGEIAGARERKAGAEASFEGGQEELSGLKPRGFTGFFVGLYNEVAQRDRLRGIREGISESRGNIQAAERDEASLTAREAELGRRREDAEEALSAFGGRRIRVARGLIGEMADGYRALRQDVREYDRLRPEFDDAIVRTTISPLLAQMTDAEVLPQELAHEYETLIRESMREGFRAMPGMPDEVKERVNAREKRINEIENEASENAQGMGIRGLYSALYNARSRLQYQARGYDGALEVLVSEAGFQDIQAVAGRVMSQDLTPGQRQGLEETIQDAVLRDRGNSWNEEVDIPLDITGSSLKQLQRRLGGVHVAWEAVSENPMVKAIVGEDTATSAEGRIAETVVDRLLTTREHTDESNHMGWFLLDYRTDDTIPFTIMNCFREPGHSGEAPFISIHTAMAQNTEVYEYVTSLNEEELAHLRERQIPGLMETITLVRMTAMTPDELREVAAGPPSSVRDTAEFFLEYPEAQRDFRHRRIVDPEYVRLERAYNEVPIERGERRDALPLEGIREIARGGNELTPGQRAVFERRLTAACREMGLDADTMRETVLGRVWRPEIDNPFHAAMERSLGDMCLHLMVEGDDRQKIFVLGLLERLDTDLSRHYEVTSRILRDTGDSRVQSEIVGRLRERAEYHGDASAARTITGNFEQMSPSARHLVTGSKEVIGAVFKALAIEPLTDADVSALSAMTGRPQEDIRSVNALIVGVNTAYDARRGYTRFHPEYKDFDACLTIARTEGAQELIEALIPHGFELDVEHARVIGQMVGERGQILSGVRVLAQLIPDYHYQPHRDSVYNPETRESEPVFTTDPYAAFAKNQSIGTVFQVLNEVRVAQGGIPMEITDGLHASLLPAGAESSPQTRQEFNDAVTRLSQAFTEGPLAGAEELLTPTLLRQLAANPRETSENLVKFGPYLAEQMKALKTQPNLSFLPAADSAVRLICQPARSLELVCSAGYPPGFVLGVLGAFEPTELTPELAERITVSIPRNCPMVKDGYNLEYCASYVHAHRLGETRILAGAVTRFHPLTKEDTVDLLTVMSFADSLADTDFSGRVMTQLDAGHGSFREFVGGVNGEAVAVLSDRYPATLLAEQSPERMLRWLKVYSTYEQTLRHFGRADKIPIMRAIAVVELMGEEERFKRNDPELLQQLIDNAETLFPKEDERAATVAYLTRRKEGADVKAVFPDGRFTDEDRTRLVGAFQDPAHAFSHTLADVCVDDRIESTWRLLDDLFHKRHFSPALQDLEALHPEGANPMQVLGDEWRACDLAVRRITGGGEEGGRKKKGRENPTLEAAAVRLQDELASLPKDQQVARLRERQHEIEGEQEHMRTWAGIRGLGVKYEGKLEEISGRITGARERLGEHAPLIEELGFRFDESFRRKVYRGDIDLLSAAVERNLGEGGMAGRADELRVLQGVIGDLRKAQSDGEQYVGGLAPTLTETLGMLETKRTHVREIQAGIKPEDGFEEALGKVRTQDSRLAGYIERRVRDDAVPAEERRGFLDRTLTEYEDSSAIADVRSLITLVAGETEGRAGEPVVHTYRHEQVFSMMLEAMRGQCLDYRTSHNSIGNSIYNIALMDPIHALGVSYDHDGRPRFDSITYLSPATIDGMEQPAIVTDPFYVPDGSVTSWGKVEGHILHMVEKADRMGIPLVVPASHISASEQMFADMQTEEGKTFEKKTVQVRIIPGPTGETYCELTGYTHYSQDAAQTVEAYVYTPKRAAAQATA